MKASTGLACVVEDESDGWEFVAEAEGSYVAT